MRLRRFAYAFTILAGAHIAAMVMPHSMLDYRPPIVPIQYGGYPPPRYEYGPPPNVERGPGWYGPRDIQPYAGGVMDPRDYRSLRRWDYEMRGPRGEPYPWRPY